MKYTFKDHLHNYAVWTASRAVQRNFTNTVNIKTAIKTTNLKNLIETDKIFSAQEFDEFHRDTARLIINSLIRSDSNLKIKATYGRAAKIISIYIKTVAVIPNSGKSNLAKVAHPPIDSILLKNAHNENKNLGLNKYRWTTLTQDNYFELIKKLRTFEFEYFWEIERFWNPTQK